MTATRRMLLLVVITAISAQLTSAQQSKEVTIAEPGIYELSSLFRQADTVALVRIVSGDTETYRSAVYKAEVLKSFKGAAAGETVYFGPYVGERLGWEYFLFLRNVSEPIKPKTTPNAGYEIVRYGEVFNEGYSAMETSYQCIFDGRDISQKCDYGVRVCTDYIRLPSAIPTFPPMSEETPFGCRAVRKTAFISHLETLSKPVKFSSYGLENRTWRIAKYRGDGPNKGDEQHLIDAAKTAEITFAQGYIHGSPTCGALVGTYRLSGDELTVRADFELNGFCPSEQLAQDQQVLNAFKGDLRVEEKDDHIVLLDKSGYTRGLLVPY